MPPGNDARTRTRRTWNATLLPYTGKEFLDSLDDGREVWIYGERVRNVGEHPAFRNTAPMLARLYDALHRDHVDEKHLLTCPTEWGGFTHRYSPRHARQRSGGRCDRCVVAAEPGWLASPPRLPSSQD
jgi:hypothetical protein